MNSWINLTTKIYKQYYFIIPLGLFLIAFLLRVYNLDKTSIYPDEVSWMVRGKESFFALKQFNFSYFDYAWWNSNTESEAISWPVVISSAISLVLLGKDQSSASLNIFSDYVAGRLPFAAFFNPLFIVFFYLTSRKIVGEKVALFASILLAIDPIHVGNSRWVLTDAFLASTTFLSIALFHLSINRKKLEFALFSGIALGLGILTKPQGLLPIISFIFLIIANRKEGKASLNYLISALSIASLIVLLFWPGSWRNPFTLFEYLIKQPQLSNVSIAYYFFGEVYLKAPWYSNIFAILTRLPIFIVIGLLSSIYWIYKRKPDLKGKQFLLAGMIFCFSFFGLILLSSLNQGARYLLPIWPWVYLISCWSLLKLSGLLTNKNWRLLFLTIIISSSLVSTIKYFPENSLFYNSLVGGVSGAQRYDLATRCLGIKEAADYVNKCYPGIESVAIIGCFNVTAPYYLNSRITTDWESEKLVITDYSSEQLLPDEAVFKHYANVSPTFTVQEKGAIVAKIYQQDYQLKNLCL